MIVEEIVARLGIQAEGLDKLKKVSAAFKGLEGDLKGFGSRARLALAVPLEKMRSALAVASQGLRDRLQSSIAGIIPMSARAEGAIGALLGKTKLLGLAAAGMGAAFALAAKKVASIATEAAKARQALFVQARNANVDIWKGDLVGKVFEKFDGKAEAGVEFLSNLNHKVKEGAKGEGDFAEAAKKHKVALTERNGKLREGLAVLNDFLEASNKIRSEDERRDLLKKVTEGVPPALLDRMIRSPNARKALQRPMEETAARRPVTTPQEQFNVERLVDVSRKVDEIRKGLTDAFQGGAIKGMAEPLERLGRALDGVNWGEVRQTFRAMGEFSGAKITDLFQSLHTGVPVFGQLSKFLATTRQEFEAIVGLWDRLRGIREADKEKVQGKPSFGEFKQGLEGKATGAVPETPVPQISALDQVKQRFNDIARAAKSIPEIVAPKLPPLQVPKVDIPELKALKAPKVELPKFDDFKKKLNEAAAGMPAIKAPKVELPKIEDIKAPKIEIPSFDEFKKSLSSLGSIDFTGAKAKLNDLSNTASEAIRKVDFTTWKAGLEAAASAAGQVSSQAGFAKIQSDLAGATTKTNEFGQALGGLDTTVAPTIDTRSIDAAQTKANTLKQTLESLGSMSSSFASRISAGANMHKGSAVPTTGAFTNP